MKYLSRIKVTNYKKNQFAVPLREIFPNARLKFKKSTKELIINDSLFIYVFDTIPYMRNIPSNKEWFENNIYHLE